MSDRDLLEKAARAAGIDIPKKLNPWITYRDCDGFQWMNMDGSRAEKQFNPLNDDGDALRLAVKLCISVDIGDGGTIVAILPDENFTKAVENYLPDPYAATRRAIVRAAAAIGEKK